MGFHCVMTFVCVIMVRWKIGLILGSLRLLDFYRVFDVDCACAKGFTHGSVARFIFVGGMPKYVAAGNTYGAILEGRPRSFE